MRLWRAADLPVAPQAVHRWAVSGTPIARGLEDLFGLLAFLQAGPWDTRRHWKHAIQDPCQHGDGAGAAVSIIGGLFRSHCCLQDRVQSNSDLCSQQQH